MEREYWLELSSVISQVDATWKDPPRLTHRTATVVRVHLWAALHDRPLSWACEEQNWNPRCRPAGLPDQSTMSRRTRGRHGRRLEEFLGVVAQKLNASAAPPPLLRHKRMDGKALPVAAHSTDRDARWGRGAGQKSKGYKLHAIRSDRPMPEQWALTPLDVDEKAMARRMIPRLQGAGYLLADGLFDASELHDRAAAAHHQLVAPRCKPGTGLGHCHHSPHRLRAIDMLESPAHVNPFGPDLYRRRLQIERDFGNLVSFGGGLTCLPPWVRRIWRVRLWVYAKLLINAARIRYRRRCVGA